MKSKRAQEAVAAVEDKPEETHHDATPTTKKRKRSGDEVEDSGKKTKKDKKKKKGEKESRREKKDKRKDLQDLPEEDDDESDAAANGEVSSEAAAPAEDKKKDKKSKKEKKEKKEKKDEKTDEPPKKKSKKDKKTAPSSDQSTTVAPDDAIPNGASNGIDLDVDENAAAAKGDEEAKAEKPDRHIVFVGNLPYTATAASISAHFASLSPIAVRCLTNKGETKHTCKGIAFVEFANVWTQRTCLDRFHHSEFNDGKSEARKINVELS